MLESVDARGELQAAAVELAKQTARVARIKAELAGRGDMNLAALKALALQPDIVAEVMQIESQQLIADREDAEREKASLARTIKTTQEQIAALKQEENSATAALEEQTRGLNRARDLMQRGLLQTIRLEDSQRAEAAAKNLLYEVQSRAAQARRDLEDAMRKLQVADDQRRIRMLEDLRDTVSLVATAQARLEAATEKVRFTGAAQSGRSADEQMDPPKVVIHRVQDGVLQPIKGDEATVLIPGDNLQITTKLEFNKLLGLTRTTAPK
jgi:polysaccharide export outer membrane protein